ncbi:MAG: hypothetical protein HYX61_10185 [Gammaproteobacteria bacterium]|nr:hypothetical protein [Gammaproteobacteria bacterium]
MKPILPSNGPGIVPHSDDNPSPDHMMLNFLKSLAKNAVQREVPHTLEELKAKKLSDLEIAIYLKEYQTAQDQYQRSKSMQALMFHDTLPHAPKKRVTPQTNKKVLVWHNAFTPVAQVHPSPIAIGQVNTNPSSLVLENLVPVSLATVSKEVANARSKGKGAARKDQNQLALRKKAQRRGRKEAQEEKQLQEQHDYSEEEAQAFLNGFESYAGFKKRRQNELLKAYDEHKLKKQKSLKIPAAAANEQPAYSFDESSETSETSDQVTPSSDEDEVANRLIAASTLLNGFRSLK